MDKMFEDQHELDSDHHDSPTPEVQKFFDLKASEEPLHRHTDVTVLKFMNYIMPTKSKFAFLINCYKELMDLISEVLSIGHKMPKDMYQSKKCLKVSVWSMRRLMFAKTTTCSFGRNMARKRSA
jgi:hypothetical protein